MEKERTRIRGVQMDNLRGLLGIRRMDKVLNARIRLLCLVMNGVDKKIHDGVPRWFSHVKKMENDRIANRIYIGKCAGSHSVGRGL